MSNPYPTEASRLEGMSRRHELLGAVRAEITGGRCEAFGLAGVGGAPICRLARKLIRAGIDRDVPLEVYREGVLAMRFASLGFAAGLTVGQDDRCFVKYRPRATR